LADKTAGAALALVGDFMTLGGEYKNALTATLFKELLVAASGLLLVLFIVGHLAGNLLLFWGPDAFNSYSHRLHELGSMLWAVRFGLIAAFGIHVFFTIWLAFDNRSSRSIPYAVHAQMGGTNLVKRTMLYSGIVIFVFVFLHLRDFSLGDQTGSGTVVAGLNAGESLGLYGLVWNSFANPVHSVLYIVAVSAVGLHLSNAVSTIWVTLGLLTDQATPRANLAARIAGSLIALCFSSIPVYVLACTYLRGV
jgi:succinate dehydrogenase / fumarate reductase cytochrome b subunit